MREVIGREERGVIAGGYGEGFGAGREGLDGVDAGGDGVVAVAGDFAEDEDFERGCDRHVGGRVFGVGCEVTVRSVWLVCV